MFFLNKKTMLAASVAVFMPLAASAATVTFGAIGGAGGMDIFAGVDNYTDTATLAPTPVGTPAGDENQVQFVFNVKEALTINAFTLGATGSNNGADISSVKFDYFAETGDTFTNIMPVPGSTLASGSDFILSPAIPNPFAIGDSIVLTFNDGITSNVGLTVTFITEAVQVPTVPVPAAGLLLGSVLLGGGIAARRKAKKA